MFDFQFAVTRNHRLAPLSRQVPVAMPANRGYGAEQFLFERNCDQSFGVPGERREIFLTLLASLDEPLPQARKYLFGFRQGHVSAQADHAQAGGGALA